MSNQPTASYLLVLDTVDMRQAVFHLLEETGRDAPAISLGISRADWVALGRPAQVTMTMTPTQ